jgi:ABC-type uncharacterized transport system substrate-binding protein
VNRRVALALLSGAAAWPLAARAQQPAMPVVGILGGGSSSAFTDLLGAFRQGLKETGYIEGQNVAIESRWAEGQFDRLSDLATDLVRRPVALIFATGVSSALAAKAASSTIPLVFLSQDDPVKLGLVTSFNQPDGNATGMSLLTGALVAKRLEFIRQLVPENAPIYYLMNPQAPESEFHLSYMRAAARDIGQRFMVLNASSERDINNAFAPLAQKQSGALIVSTDPFLVSRSLRLSSWRHTSKFPRFMIDASMLRLGDSFPTEHTYPTHTAKSACMSGRFLWEPSRPTFRSDSRRNTSWGSISRPPRRSDSTSRRTCSRWPTR